MGEQRLIPATPGVIETIRERIQRGSLPQVRDDQYRVGLVIEGGSMRGVMSGGMICGLESLGLLNAFDAVYGTSAGAIAGAFFVAGQARFGTSMYFDVINNRRFINPARLLLGRPALDVDFVVYEAAGRRRPLDWRAVLQSPVPLSVVASNIDDAVSRAFSGFRSRNELFQALRASATMALAAGPPVPIAGRRYYDGHLYEPIPLPTALADRCTHVLVLLNQPFGSVGGNTSLDRLVAAPLLNRVHKGLGSQYLNRVAIARATMQQMERMKQSSAPPMLEVLAPAPSVPIVSRTETDRARLVAAAMEGMQLTIEAFTRCRPPVAELLTSLHEKGGAI